MIAVLTDAEVRARLAEELPEWVLADGAIRRAWRTADFRSALLVANLVGHFADVAWHHPEVVVRWGSVTVRLSTHEPQGITDKDFILAAKLEEVLGWNPGGVLDGTPADAPYLKE